MRATAWLRGLLLLTLFVLVTWLANGIDPGTICGGQFGAMSTKGDANAVAH